MPNKKLNKKHKYSKLLQCLIENYFFIQHNQCHNILVLSKKYQSN